MEFSAERTTLLSESDVEAALRILCLRCPNSIVESEWRVLKMQVALFLANLHVGEARSLSDEPVFRKYGRTWLNSLGFFEKAKSIVKELTAFSAVRFVSSISHLLIRGGQSFFSDGIMSSILEALLQKPGVDRALLEVNLIRPCILEFMRASPDSGNFLFFSFSFVSHSSS